MPEKLRRFYDQFSGNDRVLVVINADPDAIASAMAVSRLLWRKVANVTISHDFAYQYHQPAGQFDHDSPSGRNPGSFRKNSNRSIQPDGDRGLPAGS